MLPLLVRQISYLFRAATNSSVIQVSSSALCLCNKTPQININNVPSSPIQYQKAFYFFPNCFHLYLQKSNQEAHCGLPTSFRHLYTPRLPTIIIFKQVFIPLIVPHGTFTAVKAII